MKQIVQVTNGTSATRLHSLIQEGKDSGKKIYNLAAGDPNIPLRAAFYDALYTNIEYGIHRYTESQGLLSLRSKIDDPDRVIITNGAKQAIYMALMATCRPGDKVAIIGPAWSSYFEMCKMLQLEVQQCGYWPIIKADTAAVIFNNPNNPTGFVYDKDFCEELIRLCKNANCWLISDEIYDHLIYEDIEFYSLKNKENVIYINGFSKTYSLTGWRFGYAVADPEVIKQMTLIQSQISGPPNSLTQYAMDAYWGVFPPQNNKEILKKRRDFIANINKKFNKHKPQAGLYFYVPVKENSFELCERFINDYGIVLTPGDEYGIEHTIRLSFAAIELKELEEIKDILATID